MELNLTAEDAGFFEIQKSLKSAFGFWVYCGSSNGILSLISLIVLVVWKPMSGDSLVLTIQLMIMEVFGSVLTLVLGLHHLYEIYTNEPESAPQLHCWSVIAIDVVSIAVICVFYFELSVDRFCAAVLPYIYQRRSKHYMKYLTLIAWLITALFLGCSVIDVSPTKHVPLCLLRYGLTKIYFSSFEACMLALSVAAILIYILTVVILKLQLIHASKTGGNMADIKARMNKKVTRVLAVSAAGHFGTYGFAALMKIALTECSPTFCTSPYFTTMYHFGGTVCFLTYFTFQQKFRMGCLALIKAIFKCKRQIFFSSEVGVTQEHESYIQHAHP